MADTVRLIDYYYIQVPDRPGEGIEALRHLQQAGVNLLAFHAFPAGLDRKSTRLNSSH